MATIAATNASVARALRESEAASPGPANAPLGLLSDADARAVREELERIVKHQVFGHSKRYPAFLRYVVERTLSGRQNELKERTVGTEALGRPATYDTTQDPVVRTTAAEVRKRLAQYYQQTSGSRLRIDLPVGSYVPHFENLNALPETAVPLSPTPGGWPNRTAPSNSGFRVRRRSVLLGITGLAAAATAGYFLIGVWAASPLEQFWRPILSAKGGIAVCVAAAKMPNTPANAGIVTINAATTASRVVGLLHTHGKSVEVKSDQSLDFAALRAQPLVSVGGFNNQWSMKITGGLRFAFVPSPDRKRGRIMDREHPDAPGWSRRFDESAPTPTIREDFAIVARVRDADSGQHVLVVGGIGPHGTSAGGEFLTSAEHMAAFAATAPPGWHNKNIEIVIATTVTDNVAGPPRVVTAHYWN
jgi:hypothetical protein